MSHPQIFGSADPAPSLEPITGSDSERSNVLAGSISERELLQGGAESCPPPVKRGVYRFSRKIYSRPGQINSALEQMAADSPTSREINR